GCSVSNNGSDASSQATPLVGNGNCPVQPIETLTTINQWESTLKDIGADCVNVTTVISSTTAEPHEYEITSLDRQKFDGKQLIVQNGAGYDAWSDTAASDSASKSGAKVINIAEVAGIESEAEHEEHADEPFDDDADEGESGHSHAHGGNPHIWFSGTVIQKAEEAIYSNLLYILGDDAKSYLDANQNDWKTKFFALTEKAKVLHDKADHKASYVATESVAEYIYVDVLHMTDKTPEGYKNAINNESEPSAKDVSDFKALIDAMEITLLSYNPQETSPITEGFKSDAETKGIPVLNITEQMPPEFDNLLTWMESLLTDVEKVL
ncbi:MAG: zinc ABC transporter substrate-binding protein, partial [Bifidobacteriaceae bacterium]|nr:zinc ABC transporter substrate-binding protein [Bifidobacteriaceae bacterium]